MDEQKPPLVPFLLSPALSKQAPVKDEKPKIILGGDPEPKTKAQLDEKPKIILGEDLEPKTKAQQFERKRERGNKWHPLEEEYVLIRELAELGWPSLKIAEVLEISHPAFAGAMIRYPRIKEEFERGAENCKAYPERSLSWRPMPVDLEATRKYAAAGLREIEIAAKLHVTRAVFSRRLGDTPQLREAFEQGEGEYRAQLLEDSEKMLKDRDPDLKYVSGLMIFKLKAQCGLTDRPDIKPLMLEGKIEHKHTLNAPKPIAIQDISEFAKAEMARATQISAEKLKEAGIPAAIDAEVVE